MSKIIAIMGSPHRNGNIAAALDILTENAEKNGDEVFRYDLCRLNIKNCAGCRKCVENGGQCVIQDDMKEIFQQIKSADTIIIGSPIYINQVNGYTKTFLDRCYPLTDEHHKPRFGTRKVVMLCTCGVPFPFFFSRYVRATGKSLKAMGLINKKNIIIRGCTTQDKVKNDKTVKTHLDSFYRKYIN